MKKKCSEYIYILNFVYESQISVLDEVGCESETTFCVSMHSGTLMNLNFKATVFRYPVYSRYFHFILKKSKRSSFSNESFFSHIMNAIHMFLREYVYIALNGKHF